MRRQVTMWIVSLIALAALVSAVMSAQVRLTEREYRIISGADVGFRIEGSDVSGKPMGRWMIRVDGQWVEPSRTTIPRRLTNR